MIDKEDLSINDAEYAKIISDILAAKYGIIACEEPILHTAVANAAALNFLTIELRKYFTQQQYKVSEQYSEINTHVENTLMFFEKNMTAIIRKNTSELQAELINEHSKITRKQIAQIKNIIENDLPNAFNNGISCHESETTKKDWPLFFSAGTFCISVLSLLLIIFHMT